MSGYYVKRPQEGLGPGNEDFAFLAEEYPAVAWLLAGRPKDHPEGQMQPLSLIVFFDSGKLKFAFSSRTSTDCCFGTIDDPTNPLASVEASLRAGRIEWKGKRR